jgi:competence protein ComEC
VRTGFERVRGLLSESFVAWAFVSLSAWLGVAPLIAYHFNIVTPFSVLLNVLIAPAVWALLILGLVTAVFSLVLPAVAAIPAYAVSLLVGGIETILGVFSHQPFYFHVPNGLLGPARLWWIILYYAILVAIAYRLRRPFLKWRYLGAAALVLVSLHLLVPWRPAPPPGPELNTLDVGHGSTFLIRTSGGASVLYDCGGSYETVGEETIAPVLWHDGLTAIDAIILSHPDFDHTCGIEDLFERFRVGAVFVSPYFDRFEDGQRILAAVRRAGVPVRIVSAGEEFVAGGARFHVLAPSTGTAFGRELSDNDTSLVVRVADRGFSVLFTGDAEAVETAILLDSGVDLRVDVMTVPHHGGRNPFAAELLQRSGAGLALISGGYDQAQIAKELESLGVRVVTTRDSGAIAVRKSPDGLSVRTFLGD